MDQNALKPEANVTFNFSWLHNMNNFECSRETQFTVYALDVTIRKKSECVFLGFKHSSYLMAIKYVIKSEGYPSSFPKYLSKWFQ